MGGGASRTSSPDAAIAKQGIPPSEGGAAVLDGSFAKDLDPTTSVVNLCNVIDSLRCYQHFNSGEIMLLVNESLTANTKGVDDPNEWTDVYLNVDNTNYLKTLTMPMKITTETIEVPPLSTPRGIFEKERPSFERDNSVRSHSPHLGEAMLSMDRKNRKIEDVRSEFNEFSLSLQRQKEKRVESLRREEKQEAQDPLMDKIVLYKSQAMNEAFKPLQYKPTGEKLIHHEAKEAEWRESPTWNGPGTSPPEAKYVEGFSGSSGEVVSVDARSDEKDSREGAEGDTVESGEEKAVGKTEECPHCHRLVTIGSVHGGVADTSILSSPDRSNGARAWETDNDGFERHKVQCNFSINVLPEFARIDADLQHSFVTLKERNEAGMQKTLLRAMRSFEKRYALNNRVLGLVNMIAGLGARNIVRATGVYSFNLRNTLDEIASVELVEERINTAEKEARQLIIHLKQLDSNISHGKEKELDGDLLLDGDSDDERLDGDLEVGDEGDKKRTEEKRGKVRQKRMQILMYIGVVESCQKKLVAKRKVLVSHLHKNVGIDDFECIRLIGRGSFAQVYLVRKKDDDAMYALKVISKSRLISKEEWSYDKNINVRNLMNELLICRSTTKYQPQSFVNLKGTFQLPDYCCFVSEVCPGGDCQSLLEAMGYLNEKTVKVIIAEVVSAVSWLHSHGVLHRDIKPDNLYIARNGHIKIGDLGICTRRKKCVVGGAMSQSTGTGASHASGIGGSGTPRGMSMIKGRNVMRISSNSDSKDSSEITAITNDHCRLGRTGSNTSNISHSSFDFKLWDDFDLPRDGMDQETISLSRLDSRESGGGESCLTPLGSSRTHQQFNQRAVNDSPGLERSRSTSDTSGTSIYYQRFDDESQYHFTVLGNPHYQSPECITGLGYDHSEDWWAVGILTFHLLAGITPFEAKEGSRFRSDTESEKDRIVTADILWGNIPEENTISPICRDFIHHMLREFREERLFYQIPHANVQEHHFFDDINFKVLMSGKGPIELDLKGPTDSRYFDDDLDSLTAKDKAMLWGRDPRLSVATSGLKRKEDPFENFQNFWDA